jgi:hypothetical protein
LIEDGTQLLQAVHCQTVGFIDDDESRGVRDRLEPGLVLVNLFWSGLGVRGSEAGTVLADSDACVVFGSAAGKRSSKTGT